MQPSASAFTTFEVSTSPLPVLKTQKKKNLRLNSIQKQFKHNTSLLKKLYKYQSRTSSIFGFPSDVTCNPAAAGSTPESENRQCILLKTLIIPNMHILQINSTT